jgi:hypothetical protein
LPAAEGIATDTSDPCEVAILVVGPFGSAPTGGAAPSAGPIAINTATIAARTASWRI